MFSIQVCWMPVEPSRYVADIDFGQDEAMRKHTMVPLPVYKTTPGSLRKSEWRLIDPGALSPWNVMSWGARQLKGLVVRENDSAPKLQVQELVLVENLQVRKSTT